MKNPIKLPVVFGRMLVACVALVAASSVSFAQIAPAAPATPKDDKNLDEVVDLTVFTVKSTQGRGYSSRAAIGLKNNAELMKTPQSIAVITSDFIEDLGYNDTAGTLQYAGVFTAFGQESLSVRGTRVNNALLDEMTDGSSPSDNVNIDSIVLMRGPAATLYRGAALGGTILKNSKWPLPQSKHSVMMRVDQHGLFRTELDSTGPLGNLGEVKVGYRLTGALQHGQSYFSNVTDNRTVFHPTLQMSYKGTLVKLGADYQHVEAYPSANNFVTPNGGLYIGAGRRESYFPNSGNKNSADRRAIKLIVEQRISDNWSAKFSSELQEFTLFGPVMFVTNVNWPNQTISFSSRRNYINTKRREAQVDVNGLYNFGGITMETIFGGAYNSQLSAFQFQGSPTFGTVTVPINNPRIELLDAPVSSDYRTFPLPKANTSAPNTPGYSLNTFVQQTVGLFHDRLRLVGGLTSQTIKVGTTDSTKTLRRVGVVFGVTPNIMLYATESTTFQPPNLFQIDVNGKVLPGPEGKGPEVGFKTSFLGGRLSSTFSLFKITLSNQSFFVGANSAGINIFAPIGSTTQKGFDFDITASPLPNLEFIATYYDGKVVDQAGATVPNSYKSHISLVGRYKISEGPFKGLMLGTGYTRIGKRNIGRGNYNTGIVGQASTINLKDGNLVNAFASYKPNDRWLLRANIENLLDEVYVAAGQVATSVIPSNPRTVSFSMTYEF